MYPIIMSQGKFIHKDALTFPFEERAMQFGDGVYEVIRVYAGKPYLLDDHIARLYQSLKGIRLSISKTKEQMIQLLSNLLHRNEMKRDGYIYLQVSRGTAPRIHTFPEKIT